eukprot:4395947-Amphidinium_carterae.1
MLFTGSSFLAPLARPGAVALDRLRTLHLSMAEPRIPLRHLAQLARRGGLRNLQVLALAGPAVAEEMLHCETTGHHKGWRCK